MGLFGRRLKMAQSRQSLRLLGKFLPVIRAPTYAKSVTVTNKLALSSFNLTPNSRYLGTQFAVSAKNTILINKRSYGGHGPQEISVNDMTMTVLKLYDKVDPSKICLEARFIEDLGLDSLDVVEVVMAFEDEFGIEFSDAEAESLFTIQQAADMIRKKVDFRF